MQIHPRRQAVRNFTYRRPFSASPRLQKRSYPDPEMEDAAEAHPVVLLQCRTPDLAAERHANVAHGCVGKLEVAAVRDEQPQGCQSLPQGESDVYDWLLTGTECLVHFVQACLDLWSSAEDSVRIAAFLAIRKLASATDASVLDLVLKVDRYSFAGRLVLTRVPEHLSHVSSFMQVDKYPHASLHQPHEEFSLRVVLHGPWCGISACFRVHPTARDSSAE